MIKAVLFDYDGVLVNSLPFHVRAWQKVFSDFKIEVKPNDVLLTEGSRSVEVARKIFKDWNFNISNDEIMRLVKKKQQIYREITKAKLENGAETIIDNIKKQGMFIGLVTGSIRLNVEKVLHPQFIAQFDSVVTGDDIKEGKPSPEAYLKAARELNVEPSQCLVIENAPLGIQAAKNAGMTVVALTTTLDESRLNGADFFAKNLIELANRWETLWN
ncbi:MAG: HAD family hydrolase [bacterium]